MPSVHYTEDFLSDIKANDRPFFRWCDMDGSQVVAEDVFHVGDRFIPVE